jgi:hypothetical protein
LELKARGYRIVHVVAATPQNTATATEPQEWQLHPPSEDVAISRWPKIPNFAFADAGTLATPSLTDLDWRDGASMTLAEDRATRHERGVPLPREAPWPRLSSWLSDGAAIALPVPAQDIFEIQEGLRVALRSGAPLPHHAEQTVADHEANSTDAGDSRHRMRGKHHAASARHVAGRATRHTMHARHGGLKHLVQVRKRSV